MRSIFNKLAAEAKDQQLVPAFKSEKPATITVGKLTTQGIVNIEQKTIAEFEKSAGFTWTECPMTFDNVKNYIQTEFADKVKNNNSVLIGNNPTYKDLVIVDMGGKLGHGVFLSPQAHMLPKGSFIGLYTGVYDKKTDADNEQAIFQEYGIALGEHPIFKESEKNAYSQIDSQKFGNICSFLQHLPDQEDLTDYQFNPGTKEQVTTQNLSVIASNYNGFPIVYFVANRDIMPGEPLGYSYKERFWLGARLYLNIQPLLFDRKGNLLNFESYSRQVVYVRLTAEGGKESIYYKMRKSELIQYIIESRPFVMTDEGIKYQVPLDELKLTAEKELAENEKVSLKNMQADELIVSTLRNMNLKNIQIKKLAELMKFVKDRASNDVQNCHHIQFIANILFIVYQENNTMAVGANLSQANITNNHLNSIKELAATLDVPAMTQLAQDVNNQNIFYEKFVQKFASQVIAEKAYQQLSAFFTAHKGDPVYATFKKNIITCMNNYNTARAKHNKQQASSAMTAPWSKAPAADPVSYQNIRAKAEATQQDGTNTQPSPQARN